VKTSRLDSLTHTGLTVCVRCDVGMSAVFSPRRMEEKEEAHVVRPLDALCRADLGRHGRVEAVVVGGSEAEHGEGAVLELRRERLVLEQRGDRKVLALLSTRQLPSPERGEG